MACGRAGDDAGLPLHLGLHAGDVIREEGNVYGGAVNIAARISGLSAPGEVLVSETVRSLARTSAGVVFEDRGEQVLRIWGVVAGRVAGRRDQASDLLRQALRGDVASRLQVESALKVTDGGWFAQGQRRGGSRSGCRHLFPLASC